jgi:FAD/FMN-containing dehydrogenase
MRLIFPHYN